MIVPMKKVAVITQAKDALSTMQRLRCLGVLHIEHQQAPQGQDITSLKDKIELVGKAIAILSQKELLGPGEVVQTKEISDGESISRHIIDCQNRYQQLEDYSRKLKETIYQWHEWGDFDPATIEALSQKNIYLRFYEVARSQIENFPSGVIVKQISARSGLVRCVAISRQKVDIPFTEVSAPKIGLSKMRLRLAEDNKVMKLLRQEMTRHTSYRDSLLDFRKSLEKELEFQEALNGTGQHHSLIYLKGFIPFDAVNQLLQTAKKERWGISIDEPSSQDSVPTLLRNPRWIEVISPVLKLLAILPGYRELDISPLFLGFLSLFFGMIIGDAGYGTAYFLLTLWLHRRLEKKLSDQRIFYLLYIFSGCAIFWGLLTGTVFGQEWYLKAGLKPFIPILNDTKFLQAFCFFLGALHLTIGHAWQAVRKAPSLTALADVGWIGVLWTSFLAAKMLILNDLFPGFGRWLISVSLFLVIFCSSPQKNIIKTIGSGLGTVALSLMNNFTDVVSYVRLFAIGLAGVAIADTVNSLAAGLSSSNIVGRLIILFIGHTINIMLGPMSVLVHGIRLNVLEFSSHAGLSWSGVAYKPLKE